MTGSKGSGSRAPTAHDEAVGLTIGARRRATGLSRRALGAACGVSGQQIEKYERGRNRVPTERLRLIAAALGLPVGALLGTTEETRLPITPSTHRTKAFELSKLALDMEEELVDHLLALARAAAR